MYPKKYVVLVLLARKCSNEMHWKACAPSTGSMNFQVMSPLKEKWRLIIAKVRLVLCLHFLFLLNYVGVLLIILRPLWPYAMDQTLRTTALLSTNMHITSLLIFSLVNFTGRQVSHFSWIHLDARFLKMIFQRRYRQCIFSLVSDLYQYHTPASKCV